MSLWRRIQRIGMIAAKFQFTISLEELSLKVENEYHPKAVVIVFTRRGRRCTSQPLTLRRCSTDVSFISYKWVLPDNLEVLTTLYRNENDISFEDKEWTFQIEDVCMSAEDYIGAAPSGTTRRRVLATRSLNLAEFASALPTQNDLKVNLRVASKKVSSATLVFTLHGLMLRTGEATDEDMISVASSMSLNCTPLSTFGTKWGSELPIPESGAFWSDVASISNQLQALEGSHNLGEINGLSEADTLKTEVVGEFKGPNISQTDISIAEQPPSLPECQIENQDVTSQTGQDLLTWCQEITVAYPGVKIKDLTICFRSGLALCAIIHHFQPEAMGDFETIRSMTPTERVQLAFDVASRLGVARVFVNPSEVVRGRGGAPDRLSMMTYLHQLRTRLIAIVAAATKKEEEETAPASNSLNCPTNLQQDESDETKDSTKRRRTKTRTKERINSGGGGASERYEQLLAKARTLLIDSIPSNKRDSSILTDNPDASADNNAQSIQDDMVENQTMTMGSMKARKLKLFNLKLFSDGMETHLGPSTPRKSSKSSPPSHLITEAAAVVAEQEVLDREAPGLERRLRVVMGSGVLEEEVLMRRWFQLISRRNALVHRAYQLSIMEKESELERTTALLNAELRELMEKDDNQKTAEERDREELLLHEVLEVVNERNEIVQELDYQEQALVNEVELGLETDALTQQTFRAISGWGDVETTRACLIQ